MQKCLVFYLPRHWGMRGKCEHWLTAIWYYKFHQIPLQVSGSLKRYLFYIHGKACTVFLLFFVVCY